MSPAVHQRSFCVTRSLTRVPGGTLTNSMPSLLAIQTLALIHCGPSELAHVHLVAERGQGIDPTIITHEPDAASRSTTTTARTAHGSSLFASHGDTPVSAVASRNVYAGRVEELPFWDRRGSDAPCVLSDFWRRFSSVLWRAMLRFFAVGIEYLECSRSLQ